MKLLSGYAAIVIIMWWLAGCTAVIEDPRGGVLATCYDGVLLSFCRVVQPPGTAVVSGSGIVPTAGAAGVITAVARP